MWAVGGETEEEKIRVDILENEVTDTRMAFAMLCYNPDFVSPLPGGGMDRLLRADWTLVCHLRWISSVV